MRKSKIGIAFFINKGVLGLLSRNDDESKTLRGKMDGDRRKIIEDLGKDFELSASDYISDKEGSRKVAIDFLSKDVDCIIACYISWGEDDLLIPMVHKIGDRPLILWNYMPYQDMPDSNTYLELLYNMGPLASTQSIGLLNRMNKKFFIITGDTGNKEALRNIKRIVRMASIKEDLRSTVFGFLPYRNDIMMNTYVDEFRFTSKIGPFIKYVSVGEYKEFCCRVKDKEIDEEVKNIRSSYEIDERVTDKNLQESVRASIGLEKLIKELKLDALSIEDKNAELLKVIGARPSFNRSGLVIGTEGDMGITVAMYILKKATGDPIIMTEMYLYNLKDNIVVTGHGGIADLRFAGNKKNVKIIPDLISVNRGESFYGVWTQFKAEKGKVTLLNFFDKGDDFQILALTGNSLGGKTILEGYPQMEIRLDIDLNELIKKVVSTGLSHHWAIAYGDIREELSCLADMLGIEKIVL